MYRNKLPFNNETKYFVFMNRTHTSVIFIDSMFYYDKKFNIKNTY